MMMEKTYWREWAGGGAKRAMLAVIAFALALCLVAVCAPARAFASSDNGTFTLAVGSNSGSGYEVAPVNVSYAPGATLRETLEASGYGFKFSGDGSFIEQINSVSCMPLAQYTGGYRDGIGYNVPATEIEALFITLDTSMVLEEPHVSLLAAMGSYLEHGAGIRNYADAKTAYDAAYRQLPSADTAKATTLCQTLEDAIAAYDSIMDGTKYSVSVQVKQSGATVTNATITLTDEYGNITPADNLGTASVVAGTYVIEASSADGYYAMQKRVAISATSTKTFELTLPTGGWLGEVKVLDKTSGKTVELPGTGSAATHQLTFFVPDYMAQTGNLYINPSYELSEVGDYRPVAVYEHVETGETVENLLAWNSEAHALNNLVSPGTQDASAVLEVRKGYLTDTVEIERTPMAFVRTPTLSSLSVTCDGVESLTGFAPHEYTYEIETVSSTAVVRPVAYGTDEDGYSIEVDGDPLGDDGTAAIALSDGANSVDVCVYGPNGMEGAYTVNITKKDACPVTIAHASGVTVTVQNAAGGVISPVSGSDDTFNLVAGATYTYVATTQQHYHAKATFVAQAGATIQAASPLVEPWIENFKLKMSTTQGAQYEYTQVERTDGGHAYTWLAPDTATNAFLVVTHEASAPDDLIYEAVWNAQKTGARTTTSATGWNDSNEPERTVHQRLSNFIVKSCYGNGATFTASLPVDANGVIYYQDFTLLLNRRPSISSLSVLYDGQALQLTQTDTMSSTTPVTKFDAAVCDYTVAVPVSATSLDVKFSFQAPAYNAPSGASYVGGYTAQVASTPYGYDPSQPIATTVPLRAGDMTTEVIPVTVSHADPAAQDTVYLVRVDKLPATTLTVNLQPADATFVLLDARNNARVWPNAAGVYTLSKSLSYTWTAGAVGYVGQSGTIVLDDDETMNVTLEVAPPNTSLNPDIEATWPGFRLGDENGSVMDTPTPTTSEEAVLYWAEKLGQGYSSGAAGCPTLVDGFLYAYGTSGGQAAVFKLDVVTGETVASGTMVGSSSFSLTPTTYAEGMVFVALAGGRVEAFDAQTLESLWVYTDPLGGQPNCPIVYKDGCIYTGFWNSYDSSKQANFVCLTITDEDPSKPGHRLIEVSGKIKTEVVDAKTALWTHAMPAGYYWAGACANGENYVLMGCDDAMTDAENLNGPGNLFSFDAKTGRIIDEFHGFTGDVRTTIAYDEVSGYYYFMTKNGRMNRIMTNSDGTFDDGSFSYLDFSQPGSGGVANCTSTPAFVNGRAYVGVMGTGTFSNYGGATTSATAISHRISVVDLNSFTEAYNIDTQGYPQTTPLITSHYLDDEGYAYVYFIENITPGKVRVIRDKPGMTKADDWSSAGETYTDKSGETHPTARVLFCPDGAHAQYAICSPIADETGTIYFKNDSAHMMAVGPTISELRITAQPDRLVYASGEAFDPTGIKAEIVYANGTVRDVSSYLEYSVGDRALTTADKQVVVTFPHVLYQNDYQRTQDDPVTEYQKPSATIAITVSTQIAPVVMTSTLVDAVAGDAYEATLSAAAEPAVTSWRVSSGALPAGLSLNAATGAISGSATALGTYEFEVTATNSVGTSAPKKVTMRVVQQPSITKPNTTESLEFTGFVGDSFEYQCEASGYPKPKWGLATGQAGQLPPGVTIDTETGLVSGTYTKAGFYEFRMAATNEVGQTLVSRWFHITVKGINPPEITTTELPTALLGEAYSFALQATSDSDAVWSLVEGELPDGLALAEDGTISGSPEQTGSFTFTVKVENEIGDVQRELQLYVLQAPHFITSTLPDATAGLPYEIAVHIAGDPTPTIAVDAGSALPSWLTLREDGVLVGTPEEGGAATFVLVAQNEVGIARKTLTLRIIEPVSFVTEQLEMAATDEPYAFTIVARGFPTPTFAVIDGELPEGFTLAEDGRLAGTPTGEGNYTFTVEAANSEGSRAERMFTLSVVDASVLIEEFEWVTEPDGLPRATRGEAYSTRIETTGWPRPSFALATVDDKLPLGLNLATDGTISGTPTESGHFTFTVQASQRRTGKVDTREFTLVVSGIPANIKPAALDSGVVGQSYEVTFTSSAVDAVYTVDAGALPGGFELAEDGTLSGTPTKVGTYAFTVKAENEWGSTTRDFTLVVNELPAFTTNEELPAGQVGKAYSAKIEATGAPAPTLAHTVGTLPAGLKFDAKTGTLSGTPTANGTFALTMRASNAAGNVERTFTLVVASDKAALEAAIAKAGTSPFADPVKVSKDGKDVLTIEKWVTKAMADGLAAALADARAVAADEAATQAQIDAAADALVAAMEAYKPQAGTKSGVDKSALAAAIAKAGASPYSDEVAISTDGTNVRKTMKWVTEEAIDNLEAAFAAAQAVNANAQATQTEVDAATKALVAAMDAYQPKPGTKASAWKRLSGDGALDTMAAIIEAGNFEKGGTVVLASLEGYWDALTAAGIAGLYDAPVVMALQTELGAKSAEVIKSLAPKKIVVCGGGYWIPDSVVAEAVAAAGSGCTYERLAGDNAAQTAIKIFDAGKKVGEGWSDTAIIATSGTFQDALAAAPLSYAKHMPIFLAGFDFATETGSLAPETIVAMQKGGIKRAYIAGGTYWLPASVTKQLEDAGIEVVKQLMGETAVETSGAIANEALSALGMTAEGMGVANVAQHYDALASAAFCGRNNSVLVLVKDANSSVIADFAKKHSTEIARGYVFGGSGSVADASMDAFEDATK